jgi:MFS family permease
MLEPLRTGSFRWLFGSNMAFFFAMGSQQVVRAWLAYDLTKSELALGLTMFAAAVPMFIMSPFGGVAADRVERRSLIMIGQAIGLVAQTAIFILIITDQIQFWHLLVSASVMGCVFPLIMPARQAIVVNIVGREGLAGAMGLGMAGMNATRIIGPAVGGFLITYLGVGGAYGFGVALFGVGLLLMLGVERSPAPQAALDKTVFGGIWEGFQYVASNRLILTMLGFGLLPMFLAMPFQNLLVVFTEEVWNVGPSGFGALSAAGGIGGIVGAFWVAGRRSEKRLRLMLISMLVFGVLLFGFSQASYFWLAVVLIFAADIFASVFSTLNNTAIQLLIPDEVRGRISAFLMMSFSLPLLGTVPVAALAEAYGAPLAVGSASLLAVAVTFIFYLSSKALRSLDDDLETARQDAERSDQS